MTRYALMAGVAFTLLLSPWTVGAAQDDAREGAELAHALTSAKVTLKQGVVASETTGKPISGKFEVEDGKLALSVYTERGGAFSEVLVDPKTGKVAKVEKIEGGDDLTAARTQADAMAKAKTSLGAALDRAIKDNPGSRPVSVMPSLKDGHAIADVTLIKGNALNTTMETLE